MIAKPNDAGPKSIHAARAAKLCLTKILVGDNELGDEGVTILCNALRESSVTKVQELQLGRNSIGPHGAKAVAAMAAVVASLTSLVIFSNQLGDEGMAAITSALKESTVSQLATLDVQNNNIGAKGAEALAAWLAVSASLTSVRSPAYRTPLSCILQMLTLDCSCLQLDLSDNDIGGSWEPDGYDSDRDEQTKFVADRTGVQAIADAVRVSASMMRLDVRSKYHVGTEGEEALRKAIEGRSGFELLL